MLSKFVFMHCESVITADTQIYEVLVGESTKDKKAIELLRFLTADSAFYCERYDNDVSEFLNLISLSLTGSGQMSGFIPPRTRLHVADMRRLVLTKILGFSPTQRPSRLAISQRLNLRDNKYQSKI